MDGDGLAGRDFSQMVAGSDAERITSFSQIGVFLGGRVRPFTIAPVKAFQLILKFLIIHVLKSKGCKLKLQDFCLSTCFNYHLFCPAFFKRI